MNSYDLTGRTAVVTGGAQGIGLAITERFVASGAWVEIWDLDDARGRDLVQKHGDNLGFQRLDITDYSAVESAAKRLSQANGKIDILVNSAGITGPNATTWDYPVDDWKQVMDININGSFHAAKAVVPYMRAADYGRILFVASVAGKEGNPNAAAYSASKAAVIALTKSLGKELADTGIAVNCITPAAAKTRIFDQMSDEHIDYMLSKIPRGRFVKTSEIASMATWICSEENSFTTGAVFDLSGGRATY